MIHPNGYYDWHLQSKGREIGLAKSKYVIGASMLELGAYKRGDARRGTVPRFAQKKWALRAWTWVDLVSLWPRLGSFPCFDH